jgi:hypothetical protein
MANPTTNFGWQMPTATDLVTDLPADFEVFGQAVDTDFVDLLGGTTGQVLAKASDTDLDFVWSADAAGMANPMTTTGDIIYSSPGSTPVRLGVGSTDDVLTVAGGVPTWAAPAPGASMTVIASGSLTGASVVLGSIPATYTDLRLDVFDYYASSNAFLELIITGISSGYFGFMTYNEGGTVASSTTSGSQVAFKGATANADNNNRATYYFKNYADTTSRRLISASDVAIVGGAALALTRVEYTNSSTAAISSITIRPSAGTFSAGTYVLYGVN